MKATWIVVLVIVAAGCGHKKAKVRTPAVPVPVAIGHTETGVASWYGVPYHGRAAANGEIYNMDKMTAAHRTLPFNTWVRIYDLDNRKTTEVRIIDRGPFVGDRIIDLSRAAAQDIEMIGPGTARVRIEVIRAPAGAPVQRYGVQVGAFRDKGNADRVRGAMEREYGSARMVPRTGNPPTWRVLVGDVGSEDEATALAAQIRQKSVEKITCFVVRIDSN